MCQCNTQQTTITQLKIQMVSLKIVKLCSHNKKHQTWKKRPKEFTIVQNNNSNNKYMVMIQSQKNELPQIGEHILNKKII
ncbi:hypothetical protein TTHERM_00091680 (macronuclear) [Tetrahymena thermophila SB210]|uniref:Uncharacterized protein n=1 Tax=Tetrahymena thermophila (strain SB210) TaxID=312017 RepID=Q236C5_TETTS|nr:hypothetical protein TTHERM_00091680 [Tetrahymena thermophila SB210]EAR92575.2 hypothetical protein TTHERM_00091680 [Tetrahymena thermophila SB210]|eukprot:XP_001012820.2 hypothetical protein TTHERM_00091680 [Tetrahymena thermophila SB210]